ncbi:MAG: serine hydrolase [Thermomicrobiales bacterium]|nr:serine hydrolase [Thermomicrobiales bacterium]
MTPLNRSISRRGLVGGSAAVAAALAVQSPAAFAQTPATSAADSTVPDWDAIDQQLQAVSPMVALTAAELVGDEIVPVHELNPDLVLPIGSSFKLWILGALAMSVASGESAWNEPMQIEEAHRSVPGGDFRYLPEGTTFTTRYFAERMIQKSDNTATDHTLFHVGRENVEAAMTAMGHHDPSLNIPILSTRELSMLKFASPTEQVDAYVAADVPERRRILEEEIDTLPFSALSDLDQTKPIEIDRIEWFAKRGDLVKTMAWLHGTAGNEELLPVREILTLETPIPFDGETWNYVGYKGGSEMGLLSTTWLLDRADGRTFVYTIGFVDPGAAIDMDAAVAVMMNGRDRLALVP